MSEFDNMTYEELRDHAWGIEEKTKMITEQIDGVYKLNMVNGPDTRDWLFRAIAARRHLRAKWNAARQALSERNQNAVRRAQHIGQLTNACFVQAAREALAPQDFDAMMVEARRLASMKVDENGAAVKRDVCTNQLTAPNGGEQEGSV